MLFCNTLSIQFDKSKRPYDKNVWSVEYKRDAIAAKALENKCQRLRLKILASRENGDAPSFLFFQTFLSQKEFIKRIERLSGICSSLKKTLFDMEGNRSDGRQNLQKAKNTCKRLLECYEKEFEALFQNQSSENVKLELVERELMKSIKIKFDLLVTGKHMVN